MRPSSLPKSTEPLSRKKTRLTVGLRDEVLLCPNGTVPFKRVQKDDLLRGNALLNQRHPKPGTPNEALPAGTHYAAITTPENNVFLQFFGAKTSLSVYNLTVDPQQISEVFLWIGIGVDGPYGSVEYGWTINPGLYGDHEPRTYSLWTVDDKHTTGCYNALCPGYVHVNQKRIMGGVAHPVSDPGKKVFAMVFSIFKDSKSGNWWLVEDFMSGKNEPMGYWPKELFPTLKYGAKVVQLGGKVYSPPNLHKYTPMGSGAFVVNDFLRTCYASNIKFVNSDNMFHIPKTVPMQLAADIPDTYKADYLGDASLHHHPEREYTFLFGGPK
ncbi:protein neprosin-like [Silene latifolia]|uniref:protein neprosin-like n=1 Tax=Silene latifolia TaxID=37657 RepID=UPI003D773720